MTITYNLGIPAGSHSPSVDQPNMQANNDAIASYVAIDHVAFGSAGSGKHNQVTFNGVTAPATPSDPTSILYTKNDSHSHPQLFFLNNQNPLNSVVNANNGSMVLMGGMIVQFGAVTGAADNNPINFASTFPNRCFAVVASPNTTVTSGAVAIICGAIGVGSFTPRILKSDGSTTSSDLTYIAIGN